LLIAAAFTLMSYDCPHDFNGNGVLNVLGGVLPYQGYNCCFRPCRPYTDLVVNWSVFSIYICCSVTKIQFQTSKIFKF